MSRQWTLDGSVICEADEYGVLRSVNPSSAVRTSERCAAGRSAFFALNGVGPRFGCLHPITSFRLSQALCLPITLYGAELWSLTKTELLMLERSHSKILRTIQGLPTRCPLTALRNLLGSRCLASYVDQRQVALTFSHISHSATTAQVFPLAPVTSPLGSLPPIGLLPYLMFIRLAGIIFALDSSPAAMAWRLTPVVSERDGTAVPPMIPHASFAALLWGTRCILSHLAPPFRIAVLGFLGMPPPR